MLDLCYVARHAARRLRFTGFPYRGFKTTGIAWKQEQLDDNNAAADGKTAAKKWTRTRSILLDEGNPIVYPEKYKLHKTRVTKSSNDAETIDSVDKEEWAEWESNPYLRMLCSPLRKCVFSSRVLPKDFMIGLKLASYDAPSEPASPYLSTKPPDFVNTSGKQTQNVAAAVTTAGPSHTPQNVSSTEATNDLSGSFTATSIFPRGIMHSSTEVGKADNLSKGGNRGHVICRRSAVEDLAKREDLLVAKNHRNPLLAFQVDSQMRRRIVHELEHVVMKYRKAFATLPWTSDMMQTAKDEQLLPDSDAEATLRDYHALILLEDSQNESRSFSTMLCARRHDPYQTLARPQIPLYRLSSIFNNEDASIISNACLNGSIPPHPDVKPVTIRTKLNLNEPPGDYGELKALYSEVYEREEQVSQALAIQATEAIKHAIRRQTDASSMPTVVGIRRAYIAVAPLLIELWRWRMWIGEGWLGDGWGIKAASGR